MDAKVAAALCTGGPIAYLVRPDSDITDEWVLEHVVPHMLAAEVPCQVCLVLGRALLWKVVETSTKIEEAHNVPSSIMSRVMSAFGDLGERNRLLAGQNPVRRANLGVSGIDPQLHVFKILGSNDVVNTAPADDVVRAASQGHVRHEQGVQDASFRFMASEIQRLRREQEDAREEASRREMCL